MKSHVSIPDSGLRRISKRLNSDFAPPEGVPRESVSRETYTRIVEMIQEEAGRYEGYTKSSSNPEYFLGYKDGLQRALQILEVEADMDGGEALWRELEDVGEYEEGP